MRRPLSVARANIPAMSTAFAILLGVALILAAVLVGSVRANARLREFRATHPYGAADLQDARQDSVTRSRGVTSGKIQEHLAPLLPQFAERFNLREARFLGAPVDYVVFEGLEEGLVEQVTFVEIKTGRSQLSSRERAIRDAVADGRVVFETMRLDGSTALPRPGESARAPTAR